MASSSPRSASPQESRAGYQGALVWLLGLLLVLAPLYRAGNRPLPSLLLELGALLLLAAVLWSPPRRLLGKGELSALVLLVVFPLLYLVPLPGVLAQWLPGRELYAAGGALLGLDPAGDLATTAIAPFATESAWLSLLLPAAAFVGTRALKTEHILRLVYVLLTIAAVQAVLGLMQFNQGKDSPLYWGMTYASFGTAVGTYVNRNHLAGLLEMLLPISLALLIYSVGRGPEGQVSRGWRSRMTFFSTLRGHAAFRFGALSVLLLVGLVFTRSRTGIAMAILGILLVSFGLSRRIGGDNVHGSVGTIVALALGAGLAIGLLPVLARFAEFDPLENLRVVMASATLDGVAALFPLGSGPGGFEEVFPVFQSAELGRWVIDYAHNDYLQWLFEGGMLAAALILLLIGLYVLRWRRVWTGDSWSRFRFVQVGAGIGLFLVLLHEFVDCNLLIPANLLYFAVLAGIFFTDPDVEVARSGHKKRRRTPDLGVSAPSGRSPPVADRVKRGPALHPDRKHPFAD